MNFKTVLLIIAAVTVFLALKTALPSAKASKACRLGYKACCSFTPYSTIIMVAVAAVCMVLRWRL